MSRSYCGSEAGNETSKIAKGPRDGIEGSMCFGCNYCIRFSYRMAETGQLLISRLTVQVELVIGTCPVSALIRSYASGVRCDFAKSMKFGLSSRELPPLVPPKFPEKAKSKRAEEEQQIRQRWGVPPNRTECDSSAARPQSPQENQGNVNKGRQSRNDAADYKHRHNACERALKVFH